MYRIAIAVLRDAAFLGSVKTVPGLARLSERYEGFQDLRDAISAYASKLRGHFLGSGGSFLGGQGSADRP